MTRGKTHGNPGSGRRVLLLFVAVLAGVAGYWFFARRAAPRKEAAPTPVPSPARSPSPRAPSAARPAGVPSGFVPASSPFRGVVAVVIDDVGWDDTSLSSLTLLDAPIALSILPGTPRADEAIALAKRKGWDLMLHLPMEPETGKSEKETIRTTDDDAAVRERVLEALAKVPGAIGLNNHQGSRATADTRVMRDVLQVVKERGLFFLDSRTTPSTQGERVARALGVPFLARDVFLDDAAAEAKDPGGAPGALDAAWERAVAVATSKGEAIVIGHPHRESVSFLSEKLPGLAAQGLRPVKVSELVP